MSRGRQSQPGVHVTALTLAALTLAGCADPAMVGPIDVKVVGLESIDGSVNVTLTTRILNTGEEPAWRIRISITGRDLLANGTLQRGSVEDPRGGMAYGYDGLLAMHEVLKPRSYVDRTVNLTFSGPKYPDPLEHERADGEPRYRIAYLADYETREKRWGSRYESCLFFQDGTESREGCRYPSPWDTYARSGYQGRPAETEEIGQPIPDDREARD